MERDNQKKKDLTPLGRTNHRGDHRIFGIRDRDRLGHLYAIGKTGTGKSTLLESMAISDIERGNGLCLIDAHGDLAYDILKYVPEKRIEDVINFNPSDQEFPIAFNPLYNVHPAHHHLVASGLISTFKKIWADSWGPRMEYILRFDLLTLLEHRKSTLLDIQPLLTDQAFRNSILARSTSQYLLSFWLKEFDKYPPALKAEAIAPILNKTGVFLGSKPLRNIVGQKRKGINLYDLMNEGKILICNFSKGELGEDASAILGSMVITAVQLAALHRTKLREEDRRPFYLYVDEAQTFVSLSFADILSESRKYGLSVFLTHQFIEQMHEKIRAAIFGNVGTIISFRVGAEDALWLEKEFAPVFSQEDLVNLPKYHMYLKLMIDGASSKPFSATTLPLKAPAISFREKIIERSRYRYGRVRLMVEDEIEKNGGSGSKQQTLFP